jgi:hypothetical protein
VRAASPCTYEGELAQRTLVVFKPDTLQRAVLGEIVQVCRASCPE